MAQSAGSGDVATGIIRDPVVFRAFTNALAAWASQDDADVVGPTLSFASGVNTQLQDVVAGLERTADINNAPGGLFARCILVAFAGRFCRPFNALLNPTAQGIVDPARFDVALFGEFTRSGPGKRSVVARTALHPTELACWVLKTVRPWQHPQLSAGNSAATDATTPALRPF